VAQDAKLSWKPEWLTSPDWKAEAVMALELIKAAGQQLQGTRAVPAGMQGVDTLVVQRGRDAVFIADEYRAGINTVDPARLTNARQRMEADAETSRAIHDELRKAGVL
jgi:hypothetical protein